jgi:hypothetical protein
MSRSGKAGKVVGWLIAGLLAAVAWRANMVLLFSIAAETIMPIQLTEALQALARALSLPPPLIWAATFITLATIAWYGLTSWAIDRRNHHLEAARQRTRKAE